MKIATEHILQCNQSEPLADAGGSIVDLMNENVSGPAGAINNWLCTVRGNPQSHPIKLFMVCHQFVTIKLLITIN